MLLSFIIIFKFFIPKGIFYTEINCFASNFFASHISYFYSRLGGMPLPGIGTTQDHAQSCNQRVGCMQPSLDLRKAFIYYFTIIVEFAMINLIIDILVNISLYFRY